MTGLSLEEVTVRAGQTVLLGPVDFEFALGGTTRIEGPSGSGKSTLLRVLAHLDPLADGTVRLAGKTPRQWGVPNYRRKVMRLGQRPAFKPEKLHEAWRRPFSYRSTSAAFAEDRAQALLAELGLPETAWDTKATDLSEGEAQRAALGRALLLEPQVLLLDEPTSALDEQSRSQVLRVLQRFLTRDTAIVLITHHQPVADALGAKGWQPAWQRSLP